MSGRRDPGSSFMGLLSAPLIYAFILPAVFLDLSTTVYQHLVFPIYDIERVRRSDYILLDRGRLPYLNRLERFNCNYCGYVNGLIGYAREVASRTEQYFCPIKHAFRELGGDPRSGHYLAFGDAEHYRQKLGQLRKELRKPRAASR